MKNTSDDSLLVIGAVVLAVIWSKRLLIFGILSNLFWSIVVFLVLIICIVLYKFYLKHRYKLKPKAWEKMSGQAFEDQVVIWLKQNGFAKVSKTEYFDRGIDILATNSDLVLGVQVKRSQRPVGVSAVRAAVAGLKSYGCNKAMVVTNASFTKQAKILAQDNDCLLIDGIKLQQSLIFN